MSRVLRFDHVGVTVQDLDAALAFFTGLGLELVGRTFVEGEFLETVCAIADSRTEIAMLQPPGGGTCLELSSFVRPGTVPGHPDQPANVTGLRNVAFEVDDVPALVTRLEQEGYAVVGAVGEWEDSWRMAYIRGPEGITVSLAQRLG